MKNKAIPSDGFLLCMTRFNQLLTGDITYITDNFEPSELQLGKTKLRQSECGFFGNTLLLKAIANPIADARHIEGVV